MTFFLILKTVYDSFTLPGKSTFLSYSQFFFLFYCKGFLLGTHNLIMHCSLVSFNFTHSFTEHILLFSLFVHLYSISEC